MEFLAENYDLAATLTSGQAFRWRWMDGAWEGVVAGRWVRLRQERNVIRAETAVPVEHWNWLRHYLQLDVNIGKIFETFPPDEPMQNSVQSCAGLRLLRQEPWECLASFICSSTKQIVQIQQIIALLCRRFGGPVAVPAGHEPAHSFPDFGRLAEVSESGLRECKLGFRAPYLLASARKLRDGEVDLSALHGMTLEEARAQLMQITRGRLENRRLRAVVRLWISAGLSGGRMDHEGIAPALFLQAAGQAGAPASFQPDPFRPPLRLCATVFVPLHQDEGKGDRRLKDLIVHPAFCACHLPCQMAWLLDGSSYHDR